MYTSKTRKKWFCHYPSKYSALFGVPFYFFFYPPLSRSLSLLSCNKNYSFFYVRKTCMPMGIVCFSVVYFNLCRTEKCSTFFCCNFYVHQGKSLSTSMLFFLWLYDKFCIWVVYLRLMIWLIQFFYLQIRVHNQWQK